METSFRSACIQIEQGYIKGDTVGELKRYRGIPYARPPLGQLRWRAPQPPSSWRGLRPCYNWGPEPLQNIDTDPDSGETHILSCAAMSEDCLYLNVVTPAKSAAERLPVFFWIHGGAFTSGAASHRLYHAERLAREGKMVVVTINYRLGVFGFFTHPQLDNSPQQGKGNFAFLDQIMALQWVRRNIAAFGGDPDHITIAGQSAGGYAVGALVASPLASGMFRRACIQSGMMFYRPMADKGEMETLGQSFMRACEAPDIQSLRHMDAYRVFDIWNEGDFPFAPIVDGIVLPDHPARLIAAGTKQQVDLIVGGTGEEFGANANGIDPQKFVRYIQENYGACAASILTAYEHDTRVRAALSLARIHADSMISDAVAFARQYKRAGRGRVFLYHFTRPIKQNPHYGAPHSAELPYLFYWENHGGPWAWNTCDWNGADHAFARRMIGLWSNFVCRGEPGGGWQPYGADQFILNLGKDIGPAGSGLETRLEVQEKLHQLGLDDVHGKSHPELE